MSWTLADRFRVGSLQICVYSRELDNDFPTVVYAAVFNIKFDTAVTNAQSHSDNQK
jgi:hypothetical protein